MTIGVKWLAIAATFWSAAFVPVAAFAQSTPGTRVPASPGAPCQASVVIVSSGSDSRASIGQGFKAFVFAPEAATNVSGSLWVNASGRAFHVSFVNRSVLSRRTSGSVEAIAFRLPRDAALESAFVEALDTEPGPCEPRQWVPSITQRLSGDILPALEAAQAADPIAAEPIANPPSECLIANVTPKTLTYGPVATPRNVRGTYQIQVLIEVNADSSLANATIRRSTLHDLDALALDATRTSTFQTEIRNCQPVAAKYVYIVEFQDH
jgi:hypothetical protein